MAKYIFLLIQNGQKIYIYQKVTINNNNNNTINNNNNINNINIKRETRDKSSAFFWARWSTCEYNQQKSRTKV